jgi:predicted lipoprotein with Yx(FWY)xxD motif
MRQALLIAALVMAGTPAVGQQAAMLTLEADDEYDEFVADGEGRALYIFDADTQGTGGAAAASVCSGDCAAAWPPLTTTGEAKAGEDVSPDLVGAVQRSDGSMQVTYNGWPLYHFSGDEVPGDTEGQDEEAFGGSWNLVDAAGDAVEEVDQEGVEAADDGEDGEGEDDEE